MLEDDVFCGPELRLHQRDEPAEPRLPQDRSTRRRWSGAAPRSAPTPPSSAASTLGEYSFIGAGAVVTSDVPAYALMVGVPARRVGWMCQCGVRLDRLGSGTAACAPAAPATARTGASCTRLTHPARTSKLHGCRGFPDLTAPVARPSKPTRGRFFRWSATGERSPAGSGRRSIAAIKDEVLPAVMAVIERQAVHHGRRRWRSSRPRWPSSRTPAMRVGCASGTDALLLPLKALDLKPGDEVITTPFTFFATAGAIHNAGGTPVFVDIDPATFNIDPAAVEAAITPRTRAIVPSTCSARWRRWSALLPIAAATRPDGDRGRRPVDRRAPEDRRRLADGRRAGHGRHALVLPEQESRAPAATAA